MIKKKKVLCAIFGCGTRSGRDKGIKRTSVQKSNKNEIFMARVKNSNCLNFCTQVDPSKTRKAVYFFFPQMYFNFREKRTFRFYPLESMNLVITSAKRAKVFNFRPAAHFKDITSREILPT